MENPILITWLNDFVFCPRSIYFHNLYGEKDRLSYQEQAQINGTQAHNTIEKGSYSTQKDILCALPVYSSKFNLIGKIDIYDKKKQTLIERKRQINTIYDGYVFQLYGQYFAMQEAGYSVQKLVLRSVTDNQNYPIDLPENDPAMYQKFLDTLTAMNGFDAAKHTQSNPQKCIHCIYEPLCDVSLLSSLKGS